MNTKNHWCNLILLFFGLSVIIVSGAFTSAEKDKNNKVHEIEFVAIPAGTFLMDAVYCSVEPKNPPRQNR